MFIKKSLVALAIGSAMLMPMTSSATVTDFGDITDTSASGNFSTFKIFNVVIDGGDTFNFSLSAPKATDLTIDLFQLVGLNIGNTRFVLTNNTTATTVATIPAASLSLLSNNSYSFSNLTNGSYSFSFIPSNILAFGKGRVTISATAVPEPETNALMLVGLGLIGFIARRKFA